LNSSFFSVLSPKLFSKFKLFRNFPCGDRIVQRRCEPLRFLLLNPARSLLHRLG
jgi:hypothetical protein